MIIKFINYLIIKMEKCIKNLNTYLSESNLFGGGKKGKC